MKFYIDTSVWGGYWDKEFKEDTRDFFNYMEKDNVVAIYSNITVDELEGAPQRVKRLIKELEGIKKTYIEVNDEERNLASFYIKEGSLSKKCEYDALHIALASICKADALVSWNFKHMVNFIRIQQYNSINLKLGYRMIDIRSPKEMLL